MLTVRVDDRRFRRMADKFPAQVRRACEISLDKVAFLGKARVRAEMPRVFDRPTPYTLNSLRVQRTRNHNMRSGVWFKEPDRMVEHYLVPQVFGGPRRLKGFERALGARLYMPSKYARLDRYGNMPYGVIVQILSVLGRAEYLSGYSANITARSKRRNRKPRDYVLLVKKHGKLPPGVYQRVQTGAGFGAKTKRHLPFGEWQKGRRRGRYASVIRARGLRPVLIQSRSKQVVYRPRLRFHRLVQDEVRRRFPVVFAAEFARRMAGQRRNRR